ncbi:MAG TPA: amidohydrolase family protein [Terriglobales bacterium]|nr:amidohydrolase family protein [Terriglobales bacterium]
MRNSLRLLCLLIGCNLCCGQTPSPSVRPFIKIDAPTVALTHARVIDGTGAPAREDQTIVISHGKIVSVSEASVAPPKEAQILDLKDYSVIPGLVGMHDHMFYPAGGAVFHEMAVSFPRLYLAGGVTTIRTTGSIEPYTDLLIKKGIDSGQTVGPHMHVTGPYLEGPGSFTPQMTELKTPEEAVATVNFWIDRGVDNFKAYNFVSRAVLGAAIQAAHKRGVKVTGHLCSIGFREAAALGIDNLEHGLDVDTEFYSGKKPDECPDNDAVSEELIKMKVSDAPIQETIRDLVAHHVALTSTLPVFELFVPDRTPLQKRVLEAMSDYAKIQFLGNRVALDLPRRDPKTGEVQPRAWGQAFKMDMEFERDFVKAGGLLLAGLDPTGIGGVIPGFGDQREVELLVEEGFTPVEAIHIASSNGAQYLGELDRIGTIAAGKNADLVVIKGNPAEKISDIENVETVFKDGVGYDSAKLIESVRGLVGIR